MRSVALGLLVLAAGTAAAADEPATAPLPRALDSTTIDGAAGIRLQGVAGVNVAAGQDNVQANVRAIGLGSGADARAQQAIDAGGADRQRDARAILGGSAFRASQGVIGVNQAAGSANAQLNLVAMGPDAHAAFGQVIDNLALAATRVDVALDADTVAEQAAPPVRQAHIQGTALRAPTGILQLNQTAGAGNASANAIVLQLPGGTP